MNLKTLKATLPVLLDKNIVPFLWGQQGVGKCLKEGTLVKTPTGSIPIEELKVGDKVYGYNSDGSVTLTKVTKLWNQGIQEVYDLVNFDQTIATCTKEHRWVVLNRKTGESVKKLKDFNVNDYLKKVQVTISGGEKNVPEAYALGAFIGDGCNTCNGLVISGKDPAVIAKVSKSINAKHFTKMNSNNYSWYISASEFLKNNVYYNSWIKNKKCHEKIVDLKEIRTWNLKSQIEFISGLIDTDGSVFMSKTGCIKFTFGVQSKIVVETLKMLLLDIFQIDTKVKVEKRSKYKNGPIYYIRFSGNERVINVLKKLKTVVPSKQYKKEYEKLNQRFFHEDKVGFKISKPYKTQCWDITVDNETHLFLLANGTITHNTQTIKQYALENELEFVHLHLATQEVGDLVGLLIRNDDGTVKHARPEWFPKADAKPGILFLDEANRASQDVIQSIFSLITEKTIHTHKLPESWKIVAAGNHDNSDFITTDVSDKAFLSRFCHIDVIPSNEEFVNFLEENEADSVANFLREQPGMCSQKNTSDESVFNKLVPNNRAWFQYIAPLETVESIEDVRYEIYGGIIGKRAASAFITSRTKQKERISGKDLLNNYEKHQSKVKSLFNKDVARFDVINSAVEEMLLFLESKKTISEKNVNNIKSLLLDVPSELGVKVIKRIEKMNGLKEKNSIVNDKKFVELYKSTKFVGNEKK